MRFRYTCTMNHLTVLSCITVGWNDLPGRTYCEEDFKTVITFTMNTTPLSFYTVLKSEQTVPTYFPRLGTIFVAIYLRSLCSQWQSQVNLTLVVASLSLSWWVKLHINLDLFVSATLHEFTSTCRFHGQYSIKNHDSWGILHALHAMGIIVLCYTKSTKAFLNINISLKLSYTSMFIHDVAISKNNEFFNWW